MTDSCAFHRTLHRTCATASANVHAAQTKFISNFLGIVVFGTADRMTTPTYNQVRLGFGNQDTGVAQNVKYCVGNTILLAQVKNLIGFDLVFDIDNIA